MEIRREIKNNLEKKTEKPLNVLLIDDELVNDSWRLLYSQGVGARDYKKILHALNGDTINLTSYEETYKKIKEKCKDELIKVDDSDYYVVKNNRKTRTLIGDMHKKNNLELELLVCHPFDAKRVLEYLPKYNPDIFLLDLGFPVSEEDRNNCGGVVVGEKLKKQGRKFSFFTSDYGHARANLNEAVNSELISEEDLRDAEGEYNKHYTKSNSYPVIPNKKGNVFFGRKIMLYFEPDTKHIKFQEEQLRAAKKYQLGLE